MKFFQRFLLFNMLLAASIALAQPIVQPCYLLPKDQFNVRKIYTTDDELLRKRLTEVRSFFASEMKRLGYGEKTFAFSTDIPIIPGDRNLEDYNTIDDIRDEGIRASLNFHGYSITPNDILLVFLVGATSIQQGQAVGVFAQLCQVGADICKEPLIVKPLEGKPEYFNAVVAHELGHAFGFKEHHTGVGSQYLLMGKGLPGLVRGRSALKDISIHPETALMINTSPALTLIGDPPTNNERSVHAENIDADVNNDGSVDLSDVLVVRKAMQSSVLYDTDLNNDGVTDEVDLLIVKAKAFEAIVAAAPRKRKMRITTWGRLKKR